MKPHRILETIAAVAALILVIALITRAVMAVGSWGALLVLALIAIAARAAGTAVRKIVPRGTVLEVDLDRGLVEQVGSDPVGRALTRNAVVVRDLVDALARAAYDPRVVGLVARLGNGGIDVAHAQELRDAIDRFRKAGKKTVAFAEAFGESERATVDYYLAAAFEEIWLQPTGPASVEGMLTESSFLRGVFEKLGIVPDFDHRREYKTAMYRFTEKEYTEPHREAAGAVAGDRFRQVVEGIANDRGLDPEEVRRLVDLAPLTPEETLETGLVDHIGFRDEAYASAGERYMFHDKYLKKAGRPHRKGKRIALVYGTGAIYRGSSSFDFLTGGSSLGADDVAKALREARDDDKVEAIVFRVDSPGGSAVGSEVVGREVNRARESGKPVVVSMGNVAGSGGYWVAMAADRIVAQPGTITGSIGVVMGKLANRATWERLGVTFDQLAHGENAAFSSWRDVYSTTERARRTAFLDHIYDNFKAGVGEGRGMTPESVEEVAKGRIWTGEHAKEIGLVDELGGLDRAIAVAKELAGIPEEEPVQLRKYPKRRPLPLPRRADSSEPIQDAIASLAEAVRGIRLAQGAQARIPPDRFG